LETDRLGVCSEALAAHEDVVLADDTGLAGADAAAEQSESSSGQISTSKKVMRHDKVVMQHV
jgi:hypothetical protein